MEEFTYNTYEKITTWRKNYYHIMYKILNYLMRNIYFFIYDINYFFKSFSKKRNYILFVPRLLSILIKKVLIINQLNIGRRITSLRLPFIKAVVVKDLTLILLLSIRRKVRDYVHQVIRIGFLICWLKRKRINRYHWNMLMI